jgi:hypothetical protein
VERLDNRMLPPARADDQNPRRRLVRSNQ